METLMIIREEMKILYESRNMKCKFGVIGGTLYRSWWALSGLQRYYYGENRTQLCEYILQRCKTLEQIKHYGLSLIKIAESRHEGYLLLANCKITANEWLVGLNTIIDVYNNDENVVDQINYCRIILKHIISLY